MKIIKTKNQCEIIDMLRSGGEYSPKKPQNLICKYDEKFSNPFVFKYINSNEWIKIEKPKYEPKYQPKHLEVCLEWGHPNKHENRRYGTPRLGVYLAMMHTYSFSGMFDLDQCPYIEDFNP